MEHIRRPISMQWSICPSDTRELSRANCHFLVLLLMSKCMTRKMVAPERDMDADQLDDMDARPGYFKKTPMRHPVYHFRVKPNHEVVWKINFLNAHGGPQRWYEMNKVVDVVAAVERYKEWWYRYSSLIIPRDEDGEDSCKTMLLPAARRSVLVGGGMIQKSLRVWLQGTCLR
jgi:hypothetical protein